MQGAHILPRLLNVDMNSIYHYNFLCQHIQTGTTARTDTGTDKLTRETRAL